MINQNFSRVQDKLDETETAMVTKTDLKDNLSSLEQRLSVKIDGLRASLDVEILRRTDEYGDIIKRLSTLEKLHGISPLEPELQII